MTPGPGSGQGTRAARRATGRYAREILENAKRPADVLVRREGSLFLFNPLTERAKAWIDENVDPDATWFGDALVAEHRYAFDLAQGMIDAGLEVE